jgi:carbon storage regulator
MDIVIKIYLFPMLVLMRRVGEKIRIGETIIVTVISLDKGRVRLGVEAPREVTVDRAEVAEKKLLER